MNKKREIEELRNQLIERDMEISKLKQDRNLILAHDKDSVEKELNDARNQVLFLSPFIEKSNAEFCGVIEIKHALNTKTEFKQAIKNNLQKQRKYNTYKSWVRCDNYDGTILRVAIKSFNLQCNEIIKELNGYNLETSEEKIKLIWNELVDICTNINANIDNNILVQLKIEQLKLENDYVLFQQEEKYRKREQVIKLREQEKADKEWIERLNILKERELDYINALKDDPSNETLKQKKEQVETELKETHHMLRERKAGWVYILSNPDMKENMYKIGLTRRPNPLVRVEELSNASHAFRFKVHAFIYSNDCFALETSLHRRFAKQRVNQDNFHKEFFDISLDEIQEILKNEFNIDCAMNDDILEDDQLLQQYYDFIFEEE